jgi:hypothetical protein
MITVINDTSFQKLAKIYSYPVIRPCKSFLVYAHALRSLFLPQYWPFVLLGCCPRIGIFPQIEAFRKNKHRHIVHIPSIIFPKQRRVGKKGHSRTASWWVNGDFAKRVIIRIVMPICWRHKSASIFRYHLFLTVNQ